MTPEIIAAIIGAVVGGAGLVFGYIERRRRTSDEYILNSLDRFVGGIQERNVGISVIGHYWSKLPKLEGVFVRLLTGQGIYIVAEGDAEKAHEFCNLERIVRLLESVPKGEIKHDRFFGDLIDELEARRNSPGPRVTKEKLDEWIQRLTNRST
jgi:hypothetical protein